MDPPFCCIHCHKGVGEDHRWCLIELFKTNRVKTVREWTFASKMLLARIVLFQTEWRRHRKPKTLVKGRVRIRVTKN